LNSLVGASFGIGLGFFVEWLIVKHEEIEEPAEVLRWSWKKARFALMIGVPIIMISFLWFISSGLDAQYTFLFLGLFFVFYMALSQGLGTTELEKSLTPNQGTRQSLRNVAVVWSVGSIGGLTIGLLAGIIPHISRWSYDMVQTGKIIFTLASLGGLVAGFIMGMPRGGYAVLNHYILRLMLFQKGSIPFNYVRFLNYCTERIFFRRVGGGYIFVHRLLMEHFAAMYKEE